MYTTRVLGDKALKEATRKLGVHCTEFENITTQTQCCTDTTEANHDIYAYTHQATLIRLGMFIGTDMLPWLLYPRVKNCQGRSTSPYSTPHEM